MVSYNNYRLHFNEHYCVIGATVKIFNNERSELTGIFFQDSVMKSVFGGYPEVLLIDATYKLNKFRMPLYILLVIDGNGLSEIIGIFLTSVETEDAISKMVSTFKSFNSSWEKTKVVLSDKDFTERNVFEKEFPAASLIICLFHTMRSFKREISCEKMGLRSGERDYALELMEKIVYSKSPEEYEQNYQLLEESGLDRVIEYYNKNWLPIKEQWVQCYKGANFTLGESTNNRLESINAKIKSVCTRYATLPTFFNQFLALLCCLRNERDHITLLSLVRKTIIPENSPLKSYAEIVTPYAFKHIEQQSSVTYNLDKFSAIEGDDLKYLISSSEGELTLSESYCQCRFWKSMNLPCRHILSLRKKLGLDLFAPCLVAERWTKTYSHQVYSSKSTPPHPNSDSSTIEVFTLIVQVK